MVFTVQLTGSKIILVKILIEYKHKYEYQQNDKNFLILVLL